MMPSCNYILRTKILIITIATIISLTIIAGQETPSLGSVAHDIDSSGLLDLLDGTRGGMLDLSRPLPPLGHGQPRPILSGKIII